jgi:hypothetical protein
MVETQDEGLLYIPIPYLPFSSYGSRHNTARSNLLIAFASLVPIGRWPFNQAKKVRIARGLVEALGGTRRTVTGDWSSRLPTYSKPG